MSTFFASENLSDRAVTQAATPLRESRVSAVEPTDHITIDSLRESIAAVEPSALLVEPRILRRVIRLDRRLKGLGFVVPHRKTYTIERDRLLVFAEREELGLAQAAELPRHVILISEPTDDESLEYVPAQQSLLRYWRMLFHARVHVELDRRIDENQQVSDFARQRQQQIGEIEFEEIQAVLLKDEFLFPEPSAAEVYVEFAAMYLELRYFAEQDLPLYFPAIRDWEQIDRIISQDIDHSQLFGSTRLAQISTDPKDATSEAVPATRPQTPSRWPVSWTGGLRQLRTRARRAANVGNGVKAAILQMRMAARLRTTHQADAHRAAERELSRVVQRLRPVFQLSDRNVERWCAALQPLLAPAANGYWTLEARLLYDLQKVCVEHERGVFKLDLIEWCRTLGRRPIRRPLPLLREVLITKHLRSAARRLATAHLSPVARHKLAELLASTVETIEHRSRDRIRPVVFQSLDAVGLVPNNLPEQVARRGVVEELLDRIVEHGVVNLGNLRDALSKNDLKLPDLAGISELMRGDRLLRADRLLGSQLDGVYRPGAIYLRLAQRLSSVAFGTRLGRLATQYIALPFGGAYLALAGIQHLMHWVTHRPPTIESPVNIIGPVGESAVTHQTPLAWILILGTWIALLIHRPRFRAGCLGLLRYTLRLARRILIDLPTGLLNSPLVRRVLRSLAYAAVRNYLLRPALLTLLIGVVSRLIQQRFSPRFAFEAFLVSGLFLNSPIGRYADERIGDFVVRAWHDLRIRVLAAAFQWVMDTFHRLLVALERIVYSVDEWLRFRAGDKRQVEAVKLVAGTCWFFVSYLVVFVFTLLVEPQVNPIKHFPVVTVSHKLILPTGPSFVQQLEPYIGAARANTLVWSTIWLIPGVFGFLVWELKENWRLYAANRPKQFLPVPIGHHGETMIGLLRPGFHSGALPKLFSAMRSTLRKAQRSGDWKQVNKKRALVHRAEESVRRFVERDFKRLLDDAQVFPTTEFTIGKIRVATNRIDVPIELCRDIRQMTWLTWEEDDGKLTATVRGDLWINRMHVRQREMFEWALAGLFQRSGVEAVRGPIAVPMSPLVNWNRWVALWSERTS